MKAIDLYKTGLIMSGTDSDEEFIITGRSGADELFFINKVLSDLKLTPVNSLSEEIEVNIRTGDAISAGIAYYLCLRAADKDRVGFLCDLYNAKRAAALSGVTRIKCGSFFKN